MHSLPSPPLSSLTLPSPTLPYPSGLSRPYPTIRFLLLLFPRIPSPTYLPSHPYHTLAFSTIRSPRTPSPRIPFPVPYPTLPYHIPPDRSRGRNVSFPTSIGYLNPSLLYPPLTCRPNTPTLRYQSTSCLSFPLLYSRIPRIPSTPFIFPGLIPYPTVPSPLLSYPILPSPLFFHLPLSPPQAYPTLPSPPVYSALPKDSEQVKGQDVLVPECIGAETVWCKTSFGGLK